jgi:RND family efflux transporter MFP subunit
MGIRRRRASLVPALYVIASLVSLSLCGCSRAIPEEDKSEVTEVAVQVGTVKKADLRARIEAYGMVEPEPARSGQPSGGAKLAAPIAGIVAFVHVIEGQNVKAGDVVVQLDDRMAQAAVEKAQHALEFAQQVASRRDRLVGIGGISTQLKEEADQNLAAARAELASVQAATAQVRLASPLDGVVAHINVQPGQSVDLNTIVAEIIDLKRLVVTVNVPADEAMLVHAGQSAEIFVENGGKPAATGSVSFVSPTIDVKTAAAVVRIPLPEDSALRPGQFVRARVTTEELDGRLAVPRESVIRTEDGKAIYIVQSGKAVQLPIKTGLRDGDLVEVDAEGLKEGDMVVTVGAYGLPKETKIRIIKR